MVASSNKETLGFQSEIKQLLDLMVHSLYSKKEIFLRELISNAADAADKLKFSALSNEALYEGEADVRVEVEFSDKDRTVTVRDNGIGMTRTEIIDNLGTIARSGTKEFFAGLTGDARADAQLIGQFGVGFYSSFIVADRVTVTCRKAGHDPADGVRWQSDGTGEFTVESIAVPARGTEVVLHLKKDAKEFADAYALRRIIKQYSDHVSVPIRMRPASGDGDWETVNTATALWTRNKKDISDDEYKEFYKHISHDYDEPLIWTHNRVEGKLEYTTLLFIPKHAPFDLWDREARQGIKLYALRVFILEDARELMPRYLRFVRGVIDTNALPLNVSREILQSHKAIDTIRTATIKRVLGLLEKLADTDDYAGFWQTFGKVLKEGIVEDAENRDRLAKLLRFSSSREDKSDPDVRLSDYVARMPESQPAIYYVIADSFATAKNSPHLEAFRAKGIEVLLLTDPIDEWLVTHLHEFSGKPLISVARGELKLDQDATDAAAASAETDQALIGKIARVLGDKVKDVRVSKRLTNSPACLIADEYAMSANMERILKAAGQPVESGKRTLEINPSHPVIQRIAALDDEQQLTAWSEIVYEQAVLAEGGKLDDPAGFVRRVNDAFVELAAKTAP